MKLRARIILLVCGCAILAGACTFKPYVPSREHLPARHQTNSGFYTVERGDTLYSIAWASGKDHRYLAAWNNIPPPYLIKPGQRLRLHPPKSAVGRTPVRARTVAPGDSLYSIADENNLDFRALAAWNNIPPPYLIKPGQRLRLEPPAQTRSEHANLQRKRGQWRSANAGGNRNKSGRKSPKITSWSWPAHGKIIGHYTPNGNHKGVDISGRKGQDVVSTAAGTVVYKGSGLRGYGQLIIVKHNDDFLSAYAHCDKIYVREGAVIKRGQKIAGMGNTGTDRVKLHFEIRNRGNPVNPLQYLPKL